MPDARLMPLAGINNVSEDAALMIGGDSPKVYLRDAVNVDISPAGKANLRAAMRRVSTNGYRNIWQSPLHGDVFATLGDYWVRILPEDSWSYELLAEVGDGYAYHEVLNNQVCVAAQAGLFTYNGSIAQSLTIPTPGAPLVVSDDEGSLAAGTYGVAVSWLRGSVESAVSDIRFIDAPADSGLSITFPMCLDPDVTGIRLYMTAQNGGELGRGEDYDIATPGVTIPLLPDRGAPPQFQYLSPMPTGKYLKYWRGRLLTAKGNVLRFSEALAYHLHDERHGFVQMPQRITFVQPVDGGIWVGQVNHAVFLAGTGPGDLVVQRKGARSPVPGTAILVDADTIGTDLSQGGSAVAMWLAENGYVVGTATGGLVELHAGKLSGITGSSGTSVVVEQRVLTAVT